MIGGSRPLPRHEDWLARDLDAYAVAVAVGYVAASNRCSDVRAVSTGQGA